MKPNLIWGVRSNKNETLKDIYRQCLSLFCTEVSQAPGEGTYLVPQEMTAKADPNVTAAMDAVHDRATCERPSPTLVFLDFLYLNKKTWVITQPSLCPSSQGLWGWCAPGFHKNQILRLFPVFFPPGWTDCGAKPSTDHCWISHCGSDVTGCLGLNLIEDLAFAASYF